MQASLVMLQPLIRFLVDEGVTYPSFTKGLKNSFVNAATDILQERGTKLNDSAISVLSGVHRKDLRTRNQQEEASADKPLSLVLEIFTRWATAPEFKNKQGEIISLPKSGDGPSFESLVTHVTRDIHPRSILDTMLQMGVITIQDETITLSPSGFIPNANQKELLSLFADNVRDHILSGTTNLSLDQPKFLEHSIFADELLPSSTKILHKTAVDLWREAFNQFAQQATNLSDSDKAKEGANNRVRFGTYFFAETVKPE